MKKKEKIKFIWSPMPNRALNFILWHYYTDKILTIKGRFY